MIMFNWAPRNLSAYVVFAGLVALVSSGVFVSSSLDETAWKSGLEQSRDDRGLFAGAPSKERRKVAVISGLSGLQVKPGAKVSILKLDKSAVKAMPVLHSGFMDQISVGDTISITNSAGKTLHFRVQTMQAPKVDKSCGDLHKPQKDTQLMNCLSEEQQTGSTAGQYRLEIIEAPSQKKQKAVAGQQSS